MANQFLDAHGLALYDQKIKEFINRDQDYIKVGDTIITENDFIVLLTLIQDLVGAAVVGEATLKE